MLPFSRFFAALALVLSAAGSATATCPACQNEKCTPLGCICLPVCNVLPTTMPPITPSDVLPDSLGLPLSPDVRDLLAKGDSISTFNVQQLGDGMLSTAQSAGGELIQFFSKAGGDTVSTVRKAGSDTVKTVVKSGNDTVATYTKGWRDTGAQSKRSFKDAVDAEKALAHYTENQVKAQRDASAAFATRLKENKPIDAIWGFSIDREKSTEKNAAKATQESKLVNQAGATAAATYGGPGGAAAYAAWSTYRATGDGNKALRAGIAAGVTAQLGSSVASMPAGTTGEIIKKAALAGAAGGIAVAAAGGDDKAITEGFLRSAGAVLVQSGTDKLKAYSPKAKDAYDTVQCISARDVNCLSNTTWAKDAKGKILYDKNGKPRIDPSVIDPKTYTGKWSALDPNSVDGKRNAYIASISKLPDSEAIPLVKNQWILTWSLGNNKAEIPHGEPTVVLTYVGKNAPFDFHTDYGMPTVAPSAPTSQQNERAPKKVASSRIAAFSLDLIQAPGERRRFHRSADGTWTEEILNNGDRQRFRVHRREKMNGCNGTVILFIDKDPYNATYEVFFPDLGCPGMMARSRIAGVGPFQEMGLMKNIRQ